MILMYRGYSCAAELTYQIFHSWRHQTIVYVWYISKQTSGSQLQLIFGWNSRIKVCKFIHLQKLYIYKIHVENYILHTIVNPLPMKYSSSTSKILHI